MIFVCSKCGSVFHVMGDPGKIDVLVGRGSPHWPNGYKCPMCGGAVAGTENAGREMLSMARSRELEPEEALMALVVGLGLPEETDCSGVKALLEGARVEKVHGNVSGKRFVLEYLDLEGGVRVYLAGSPQGALVYRLQPRFSYAERVHDD